MSIPRIIQVTLLGAAAMVFAQPVFCQHPDLTGTYRLDVAASTFGSMPLPDSGTMTISNESHKRMRIELVLKDAQGEHSTEAEWKTDDRFHPVVGSDSGSVLAKWNGPVLTGKRVTQGSVDEFQLVPGTGEGGSTLIEHIQSSQGNMTLVWRRQ